MPNVIKIAAISDTHGMHELLDYEIEACGDIDILIHCGDHSGRSTKGSTLRFLEWFGAIKNCKHKVFIAGNHDMWLETEKPELPDGVTYLENSGVVLEGVKLWGTPITPQFGNWAFMGNNEMQKKAFELVPDNLDVLITHGPPYQIFDYTNNNEFAGSGRHLQCLKEKQPKYNIFGHIHEGSDKVTDERVWVNTTCCNVSMLDGAYRQKRGDLVKTFEIEV